MDAGWTKERLMAYYALTEAQYEKVLRCLRDIGSVGSGEGGMNGRLHTVPSGLHLNHRSLKREVA
jgi:hypothetical protein